MPQRRDHEYTPKGPQYSEESIQGIVWIMILLLPFMLITSCFRMACTNETRAESAVSSPTPEPLPPSPPADL